MFFFIKNFERQKLEVWQYKIFARPMLTSIPRLSPRFSIVQGNYQVRKFSYRKLSPSIILRIFLNFQIVFALKLENRARRKRIIWCFQIFSVATYLLLLMHDIHYAHILPSILFFFKINYVFHKNLATSKIWIRSLEPEKLLKNLDPKNLEP